MESTELFLSLGQEQRAAIRQKLLACFPEEQGPPVRNKIGDAIAELARQYTDNSMCRAHWPSCPGQADASFR
jgi:importin-5